jgi:hypothetical protein
MSNKLIIEQKLLDLELVLNRQEELIAFQRDVVRSLKDLIKSEYAANSMGVPESLNGHQPARSMPPPIPVVPTQNRVAPTPIRITVPAVPSTSSSFEPTESAGDSEKSAKRARLNDTSAPLTTPAPNYTYKPVPPASSSSSSSIHINPIIFYSTKRKRALEKVRQVIQYLPHYLLPQLSRRGPITSIMEPLSASTKPSSSSDGLKSGRILLGSSGGLLPVTSSGSLLTSVTTATDPLGSKRDTATSPLAVGWIKEQTTIAEKLGVMRRLVTLLRVRYLCSDKMLLFYHKITFFYD